jgi:hypothetical protein
MTATVNSGVLVGEIIESGSPWGPIDLAAILLVSGSGQRRKVFLQQDSVELCGRYLAFQDGVVQALVVLLAREV